MIEPDVKGDLHSALSYLGAPQAAPPTAQKKAAKADRRRPGRLDVSATLLPLLRGDVPDPVKAARPEQDVVWEKHDPLGPARGITIGLLISVPLWVGIYFAGRALLRLALRL